jgi:hypothetical protein
MRVSLPSATAPAEHELGVRLVKVCERFDTTQIERNLLACFFRPGICHVRMKLLRKTEYHRPHGYPHCKGFPVAAMLVFALPVRSSPRPQVWLEV